LFEPPAGSNGIQNKIGDVGLYEPNDVLVAVSSSGATQIVATDGIRLHFWNMPNSGPSGLNNGQPESGYAGTSSPYLFNTVRSGFGEMAEDPTENYLWVVDQAYAGVRVDAYTLPLPLSPEVAPVFTVNSPLPVLGQSGQVSWTFLTGTAMDSAGNLWIADNNDNRVMRVRILRENSA